ncbi:unnamed protein product [Cuscuta europaea]|uniref:Uncharacterized protein n=1 Tax=Cuscuta europaea TaxID=41803 RepID=A0A9P0ZRW5_CUSEU|nr:unnamed protein product [Cuscuta europaea]
MASQSFIPQHILDPKNSKQAKLSEYHVDFIRSSIGFPHDAVIRFPATNERIDWFCDGWVNFLMYPFKIGMKFPFSRLVRDFLAFVRVSPSQIMPQVWRVLRALEVLSEKHSLALDFEDLGFTYDLRSSGAGRFTLAVKEGKEALIHKVDKANDRGWMNLYFFVNKESLGADGSFLEENLHKERKTIPLVPGLHSEERNARILSFPIEDRTYVNLVSDFQEDSGQGYEVSKDDGEGMSAFVPLQVVFPIVKNTPVPPLKDSTPIAATSSSTSRSVPSDHELLAMASRRKRMPSKLSANPPKVPKYPTPDTATAPNAPHEEHKVDTWAKPPQVMHLSLSPEFCELKDALTMKDETAQFQMASSAPFFDCLPPTGVIAASSAYAFQSVQASLVAAARVSLLERTVDELKQ